MHEHLLTLDIHVISDWVFSPNVISQMSIPGAAVGAVGAGIGFLPSVNPDMPLEVHQLPVSLATNQTLILGPWTSVLSQPRCSRLTVAR